MLAERVHVVDLELDVMLLRRPSLEFVPQLNVDGLLAEEVDLIWCAGGDDALDIAGDLVLQALLLRRAREHQLH